MTYFLGGPVPPEYVAQVQAQQQQEHMAHQDQTVTIHRFLEELPPEQLVILMQMLQTVYDSPNAPAAAFYYIGLSTSIMRIKHSLCVCGVDHLKEMAEADEASVEERRIREQFEKYGVTLTGNGTEIKCNNCLMTYVSLADRMLRPPGVDGCGGCQQKGAWG
jgi:hypothetical protein